ncbi:phosphopantetheine-binding protein [Streptomyces sp. 71268]|uniref:phosphopantetheine-binding protein n=1 Tax=Streptomyces sp. 71268 TaxID=3002640 RepID=UPI0023F85469|nr:phosphopantetheine-binding protein [Streptomyces sp. 71268]WEV24262.1 phosphopantetheine-binding protein [Streptomyces sp. 71268]
MTAAVDTQKIRDRVVSLMDEKFGLPAEELLSGASFEDLDIDSLILIELGLLLRKEMGVVLQEGELKSSHTLDEAVAVIEAKGPRV